ncbi:MAG TPA: DUF4140 domain-containing protein [Cyclobacteriaceae bacterium]|nr:DUF4140 domain-containing protein [Cyclobacteriaceae bacterium]
MEKQRGLHLKVKILKIMTNQLLTSALVMSALVVAAQPDKPVDSKITDVTVFLNKAQVSRTIKTRLEAGKTNLIVTGLSSQLDPQSRFQVKAAWLFWELRTNRIF